MLNGGAPDPHHPGDARAAPAASNHVIMTLVFFWLHQGHDHAFRGHDQPS
jgi:hypothetical protein